MSRMTREFAHVEIGQEGSRRSVSKAPLKRDTVSTTPDETFHICGPAWHWVNDSALAPVVIVTNWGQPWTAPPRDAVLLMISHSPTTSA